MIPYWLMTKCNNHNVTTIYIIHYNCVIMYFILSIVYQFFLYSFFIYSHANCKILYIKMCSIIIVMEDVSVCHLEAVILSSY